MHRILSTCLIIALGCTSAPHDDVAVGADSAFAALQTRGAGAMGVDQYTSSRIFESLPDGGRILLQRDSVDAAGTEVIRAHIRYAADTLPRGAQVRITTEDTNAVSAIHAFLAFQRMDHRAAGHDGD